eukprot:TRINITY_DN10897_c0_g1_i2.p1 TRINITY_DN10897_c0_g1~~TRINITY_DN10897_c0_g1_i2.p1  ORF type:complete len:674 (-),score=96.73 TRINITY_DN10897_c0_g1_i2:280-2268(-)
MAHAESEVELPGAIKEEVADEIVTVAPADEKAHLDVHQTLEIEVDDSPKTPTAPPKVRFAPAPPDFQMPGTPKSDAPTSEGTSDLHRSQSSRAVLLRSQSGISQAQLSVHSLGGAIRRANTIGALKRTNSRANILIVTAGIEEEKASDTAAEGEKGVWRQRLAYAAAITQKYSIPLVSGVIIALIWSNVDEHGYDEFTHWMPIPDFKLGSHGVTLHFIVNDFFMCFFFGLAIKEVTEALLPGGCLSPLSRAINPLLATLGGVFGPIVVYIVFVVIMHGSDALNQPMCLPDHRRLAGSKESQDPAAFNAPCSLDALLKGWGVPTATDISLAWMFALLIFGTGHPAINFLLLLAILDDALGMMIIAIFYPDPAEPVEPIWLLLVLAGIVVAFLLRKLGVPIWQVYVFIPGPLAWAGLFKAHVHPALALVAVVPFMPACHAVESTGIRDLGSVIDVRAHHTLQQSTSMESIPVQSVHTEDTQDSGVSGNSKAKRTSLVVKANTFRVGMIDRMYSFESWMGNEEEAPLHVFEHTMKLPVDLGMFFFGLVNAGVKLNSIGGITAGVVVALVVGKTLGITLMSLLGICIGAPLPSGVTTVDLLATSTLGGIGLTVALFVANEAFVQPELRGQAKMGAVISVLCGLIAFGTKKLLGGSAQEQISCDEES